MAAAHAAGRASQPGPVEGRVGAWREPKCLGVAGWSKPSREEHQLSRLHLVQIWDIAAVLLLLPVLALIGSGLPGDWQVHGGSALTGTATVVAVEPVRTGKHILVDVSNDAGRAVATRQEVNGEPPQVPGTTFAVTYLPPDEGGRTQVYVAGHDPFITNLLVFGGCIAVWLAGLLRVSVRLLALGRRWSSRKGPKGTGPSRAGYGYTRT